VSPAGAAAAQYPDRRLGPYLTGPLLLAALVGLLILISGGKGAARASQAPAAALSPAWSEFQADCTSGPSPGQGFPAAGCRCWEANLQEVDIFPPLALNLLLTAQAGADERWMVVQSLGDIGASDAMDGCGLD
jgi:hypothetical protein